MMTIDNHDAKIFTDDIEVSATEQIKELLWHLGTTVRLYG